MRRKNFHCVSLPLLLASLGVAQEPPVSEFRDWAKAHAKPIAPADELDRLDDLKGLAGIAGDAQIISFGEPIHGAHEPLAMRNRIIRYAVAELGVRAVAIESGVGTAKILYDHVLGTTTAMESQLRQAFTYGFGGLEENIELLGWLRAYNANRRPDEKVRLYAIDLSGQLFPLAYRSVEAVLAFIDRAEPARGAELRKEFAEVITLFRSDKHPKLEQFKKDEITGKIQGLIAWMERERSEWSAATSADDFDWALQQALAAAQDDAFLRSLPPDFDFVKMLQTREMKPSPRWRLFGEMREIAMANNVAWVQRRTQGRVLFFAHNSHIQMDFARFTASKKPTWELRPAGSYLRSMYGKNYVVIGSLYGGNFDFSSGQTPLNPEEVSRVMGQSSLQRYAIDLRELPREGSLRNWFDANHTLPLDGRVLAVQSLTKTFDALVYLDAVTPSRASVKFKEVSLAEEELKAFAGVYKTAENRSFIVRAGANQLLVQRSGSEFPLYAHGSNEFFAKACYCQAHFTRGPNGGITAMVWHERGNRTTVSRVTQ